MTIQQFKLKDLKPDKDFIEWNESMSKIQDIDFFYEHSHPFIKWVEKLRLNAITDLIKKHIKEQNLSNPVIIEAGCGAGHVLAKISSEIKTNNLIGIDPLDGWLNKAKERLQGKAKLIKGFAENLPFDNKSVNITICTEVIEHVIDPTIVLKELKRVTKDNGLLIVSIPNENLINRLKDIIDFFKIYQKLFSNIPRHNDDQWHLHCFDLKSFQKRIPPGLQICSITRIPLFILPLRYVLTLK